MMRTHGRPRHHRRAETGATLVEFALVAPVCFLLIFGMIAGCYLAYQNSALHDGATAGARMASIETSLNTQAVVGGGTEWCESDKPVPIETAVAQSSPLLAVDPNRLCAGSPGAGVLTQQPVSGDVSIIVTCVGAGGCAAPDSTQVSLSYTTGGLVAPFGLTYNLAATSQDPVQSP
jgi:hypothetical protein